MVAVVLHELIEAQAKRTPHAPALVYEQQRLTYAELDERANRLAHTLAAQGVGPDVTVGLHVERSLEMIIGILAILKAAPTCRSTPASPRSAWRSCSRIPAHA
jgi:non-ribosomal peptide synthetase component F